MERILKIGFALSAVLLSYSAPSIAVGATVFMESEPKTPAQDREFIVRVLVSSDQPLNAYDVNVSFPTDETELIRTDTARSLITVWPKQPEVSTNGVVRWKGASTEPFTGERGELLVLHLRARAGASQATLSVLSQTALYLANGKGTKVVPAPSEFTVVLAPATENGTVPQEELPKVRDSAPPDISFIALEKDPITSGQKLLSFQANDEESGVANVEIRTRSWLVWSGWRATRNPDALPSGIWEAELRVTDHEGNLTTAIVHDWNVAGAKGTMALLGIAIMFWLVLFSTSWLRRKRLLM